MNSDQDDPWLGFGAPADLKGSQTDTAFRSFVADAQREARLMSAEDDDNDAGDEEPLSDEELLWRNRARMAVAVFMVIAGGAGILAGILVALGAMVWILIAGGIIQSWFGFLIWRKRRRGYRITLIFAVLFMLAGLFFGGSTPQITVGMIIIWGLVSAGLWYSHMTFDH